MRWAIFSDVHSNLPALEHFISATRSEVDGYICLGDVVNYGPWNDECLELILALPQIVLLRGNHEQLFLGEEPLEAELPLVREFYKHSIRSFTKRELIADLPVSFDVGEYHCVHTIGTQKIYPDSKVDVERNYMVGHTHHQCRLKSGEFVVVNVGSVGQNRGRTGIMNYALYDTGSQDVQLCAAKYPYEAFLEELKTRRYPAACIEYYEKKLAD